MLKREPLTPSCWYIQRPYLGTWGTLMYLNPVCRFFTQTFANVLMHSFATNIYKPSASSGDVFAHFCVPGIFGSAERRKPKPLGTQGNTVKCQRIHKDIRRSLRCPFHELRWPYYEHWIFEIPSWHILTIFTSQTSGLDLMIDVWCFSPKASILQRLLWNLWTPFGSCGLIIIICDQAYFIEKVCIIHNDMLS